MKMLKTKFKTTIILPEIIVEPIIFNSTLFLLEESIKQEICRIFGVPKIYIDVQKESKFQIIKDLKNCA
jgi:hypothetical protein